MGNTLIKKPSVGMVVGLLLSAGFVLGMTTFPGGQGLVEPAAESGSPLADDADLAFPSASDAEFRTIEDDPRTRVYEPFIGCSADYVNGAGADLDRKNTLGPDNSVVISPSEMKALGMTEAAIRAQTLQWNKLTPEEREEQLCRAAQQNAAVDEVR